jgi:hypothetical protein
MRIGTDHAGSPTQTTRNRISSARAESGFADTLATAVESDATSGTGSPPELSAATYRLFASVFLERGDTERAAAYLAKVPDAREAGLPVVPSGVLAENGRWDYTTGAAALTETGIFDSANGQGARTFEPYVMPQSTPAAADRTPTESARPEPPAAAPDLAERLRRRGGAEVTTTASAFRTSIEAALIDRIG